VSQDIQNLIELASKGLVPMFDDDRQLFCDRLIRKGGNLQREGFSPRYTIMTLLGLRELERSGGRSPFDCAALYRAFMADMSWIRSAGDLGLVIWLTSAFAAEEMDALFKRVEVDTALERYPDAREGRTMELAWFLSGLSHATGAAPSLAGPLTDLAVDAYHRLEENQGEHGFFCHMNTKASLEGRLRGRIGSFADQIYPIYAMAKFAKAFNIKEPVLPALRCAEAICSAQGRLGQWWWLYDSRSGRVSSHYPVYSVHQHGMAPMGLFALEEASGHSFKQAIYRGLQWIYGSNELLADMRDLAQNLIWRCIRPASRQTKYWETAMSLIQPPKQDVSVKSLTILYEDRPYELGWLLYAFARFTDHGTSSDSPIQSCGAQQS
jgi:hypothetical protein